MTNKEYDEMREALGEAFRRILSEEVRFRDSAGVWRPMIGLVKEMASNLLDEVSSAKTDTCRVAVVRRKYKLPHRHGEDLQVAKCEKCRRASAVIDSYSHEVGISDMLKAGFVQEEKDD